MLKHTWSGVPNGLNKPFGSISQASNPMLPPTSEDER